jgi:hypothetical protein
VPLEEPEQSSQALRGRRKGSEGLLARKTLRENTQHQGYLYKKPNWNMYEGGEQRLENREFAYTKGLQKFHP